jgi:hypothetical protein
MYVTNAEEVVPAGSVSPGIQPFDYFLNTERTGSAVAVQIQFENKPYRFGFDRINGELPLDLCAALLCFNKLVAQRHCCPVPESLAGIFLHRSDHVLGILLRLIFVKQSNDLSHHCMNGFGFVANRLGYGNDLNVVLGKLTEIEFLLERLAEETAITVDHNYIERVLAVAGALDHLLEHGPAIIASGRTSFDKLRSCLITVCAAPRIQLAALIRDREIMLSLAAGRYPHIERCARCGMTSVKCRHSVIGDECS